MLLQEQVQKRISNHKRGKVFFPQDFHDQGKHEAVNKTLQRLEKRQVLLRLSRGVYLFPKKDAVLGTIVYPSLEEVAQQIAKRDRARIMPTGILALNKLGLSTQVPMRVVYLTDGSPRSINIGKRNIRFRKAAPKSLLFKGKVSGLVVQALKELGQQGVTPQVLATLKPLLKQEKPQAIQHDAALAPLWVKEIMLKLVQ